MVRLWADTADFARDCESKLGGIGARLWLAVFLWAVGFSGMLQGASDNALWETFRNPPTEARASCYWWWKGDLTAAEMGRQLRLLKAAGLGGAHIIPWRSDPAYLSPQWLELLRVAAEEARREGLILDLSANAAWPFRGSWVPPEESLNKVELTIHPVEGPRRFTLPAAADGKKAGKAKNVGVAGGASRILMARLAPEPLGDIEQMRDVTADLSGDGAPGVDVPVGRHTLYVVRLLTGVKSQADYGRVPDHFNAEAIGHYLQGFAERVAPALGGRLGDGLRAMYCDSIEISEANWTPGLPAEFERRCGYDLMPYLPLVLKLDAKDKPPAAAKSLLEETIARVRYDYCRVLVDLFLEGLGRTFHRWCHDQGTLSRWQAYGWPWFYGIEDGYRIPDMPEGNNWLLTGNVFHRDQDIHGWPVWQKYTSSGAHQAGRRIASTEAATVTEGKFQETLDMLKRQDDFNFACGINHSFLHGFCYSPAEEPFPGRSQYGTYFSEQNPWWPYLRYWTDYNARLSGVFQASRPVAQVALLFRTSDVWAQAGLDRHPFQLDPPWAHQVWRWINQNGANADYVSDRVLQSSTFEDGRMAFGPMRYDALVVLGARTLEPSTAEALERYALSGGRIVFMGSVPEASPGLHEAEANDGKVRGICQRLLREHPGRVMRRDAPGATGHGEAASWWELLDRWRETANADACRVWADQLLADLQVRRSVQLDPPAASLYQIHYRHGGGQNLYFFSNHSSADVLTRAAFPGGGRRFERWDPETAVRDPLPVDKDGRALLALPPGGSLLLVADEGEPLVAADRRAPPKPVVIQEIEGPWSVTFKPADGETFEIAQFELMGLHESKEDRMTRFAGRAIYRCRFEWDGSGGDNVHVDLGRVPNCVSEVACNGRPLGVRWYGRHDYVAGPALRRGTNELEVAVVTTLFNRLRGGAARAEPCGLIGQVKLWRAE